jgi:uncharacterized membrane protein
MPVEGFIQFQQIVHINYLRVLPALSTIAVAATIAWALTLRNQRTAGEFRLVIGAAAAILIGYVITIVFNVPVNDQLELWSPADPPANAREIWSPWETAHVVRTVFWVVAFGLEVVALTVSGHRRYY